MSYLSAAVALGFPADCATNGRTYDDLVRTWNSNYGDPPLRAELEANNEKIGSNWDTDSHFVVHVIEYVYVHI